MKNKLKESGSYEIFKTTEDHDILRLEKDEIFAIVETNRGHILVKTDEDHQKQETIQKGRFYLSEFNEDPSFQDMPHLFLEKDGKYHELILPAGLPNNSTKRRKIIFTDDTIKAEKILRHSKNRNRRVRRKEDLATMEKKELDRVARKMNIEGRSKMNKKELTKAIDKVKE